MRDHDNYSPDWCTAPEWWEWVCATVGGVDLDPCAAPADDDWAAVRCIGEAAGGRDGLSSEWRGRVYCNPPGANSTRSIKPWWAHAMDELEAGRTTELVWCFFNMEAVFSLDPSPLDLPGWLTMPSKRVQYWRNGAPAVNPETGKKVSARNRTWFWSTCRPASPPIASWIVETGSANVEAIGAEIRKARAER